MTQIYWSSENGHFSVPHCKVTFLATITTFKRPGEMTLRPLVRSPSCVLAEGQFAYADRTDTAFVVNDVSDEMPGLPTTSDSRPNSRVRDRVWRTA